MAQEFRNGKTLPSRKELRLAREAAERKAKPHQEAAVSRTGLTRAEKEARLAQMLARCESSADMNGRHWAESAIDKTKAVKAAGSAASPLQVSFSAPDSKESSAAAVCTGNEDVTEAIPTVRENKIACERERRNFNAKFVGVASKSSSFLKNFVQKSPALSAVALAGVLVTASVGVIKVQNAVGAPGFAAADSVLDTVHTVNSSAAESSEDVLKPTAGAAETAKMIETQLAANQGKIRCAAKGGANDLASAYENFDNAVFFPMQVGSYRISSPFGMRANPFGRGTEFHTGVDFAAPKGTPIYAAADGEVVMDGSETPGNNDIRIKHEINGKVFYTWYLHSYRDGIFVKVGQKVKAGEKIAEVGSSGQSTGSHLHFEIRPSKDYTQEPVEPISFISELGAIDITQKCS
ncbi:M23 family metallopeptidase [Arcanobacterium hippocoleae]